MKNKLKFKTIDINKKKIIIAILSVFIITVGIMIIKKAYSTSSPLDNQVVNGLSFENVNLNKKDGITTFECEVINDNYFNDKGNKVTKEEYDKVCTNPGTGINLPYFYIAGGILAAGLIFIYSKKHKKLNRI